MAKKINSIKVKLLSTASKHFYTTVRAKKFRDLNNKESKLIGLKKYDPFVRRHVEYIEKKIDK